MEDGMSAQDVMVFLENSFKAAPISKTMGLHIAFDEAGHATISMTRRPDFDHGMQDTHGGVFATMLDSAGWFTVAAQCRKLVVTADLHVRMLQAARHQDLVATARLVRGGGKLAVAEMSLKSADGELVATGTASFSIISDLPI
jgi:uncharacterized protein (TIGR00369 family)